MIRNGFSPIIALMMLSLCSAALAQSQDRQIALRLGEEALVLYHQQEKDAFRQAIEKWRQMAALWHTLGDRQQEGQALSRMGRALYVLSEYRAALATYSEAAQAFHDAGDRVEEGRCLFDMAATHGTLGELSQAEKYHFQAVQLWREINEPELPLLSGFNIGRAYRFTGDWQKARDMFNQLLATARAYPHPPQSKYYEQQALSELGYTEVGAGQPRLALYYFAQALPWIQADLEHPYDTPFVLNQMARAWLQLGNTTKAHDLCQQALQSARRLGQRRAEAVALTTLGRFTLCWDAAPKRKPHSGRHRRSMPRWASSAINRPPPCAWPNLPVSKAT